MTISKPLEYNGHTYQLSKATTWTEAQAEAKSLGGNLVTIKIGFIALALCLSLGITQNANADFSDDFSAGNLDKWALNSPTGGDFSVSDGELLQTNTSPGGLNREIVAKDGNSWSDYTLSFKARVVSGFYSVTSFDIFFRLQNQPTSSSSSYGHPGYFFQLHGGGQVNLFKIDPSGNLVLIQTSSKTIVTPNYTGYQVKITAIGDTIKAYVDDVLMIDTIDSTYKSGSIGFSTVHFVGAYDDVKVIDEKPIGLVAHWSFDDCTAKDNSGNGHDGTIQNNVTCVDGIKSQALHLQGSGYVSSKGGHILLPKIDFSKMTQYSMCLWVKEEGMTSSDGNGYISFGDFTGGSLGIVHAGNTLQYGTYRDNVHDVINIPFPQTDLNKFVYHCLSYESGKLTAYKDGISLATIPYQTIISGDNAAIGRSWWFNGGATGTRFIGIMDDVRIYNRALSEAEVMALYNGNEAQPEQTGAIDLSLDLTAPATVKTSETATYQLTATNNGNSTATGVKAHFVVPRKSIATVEIPKNCTLIGRIIECALPDLDANQSATQTFSMTALRKGAMNVVGLVNSDADDANLSDNKLSAVVSVK